MSRKLRSASAEPVSEPIPETIPDTIPVEPASADAIPTEWAMSVWIDKHGNRYYFKESEMVPDNPAWRDLINAIVTPPKPPLRPVGRFWIHRHANKDNPIWFDDEQLVDEAVKLTNFRGSPEDAAKTLGFNAGWFVVESVAYEEDGVEFIKNEPVEDDKGQWYPATDEEIAAALAEMAKSSETTH
ncbi:hypothetical protein IKF74_00065 [Candidatus Saccharibacteria bacterium]|nr:hypothetical protein [Candidatus Saccharibacteria bacterium]